MIYQNSTAAFALGLFVASSISIAGCSKKRGTDETPQVSAEQRAANAESNFLVARLVKLKGFQDSLFERKLIVQDTSSGVTDLYGASQPEHPLKLVAPYPKMQEIEKELGKPDFQMQEPNGVTEWHWCGPTRCVSSSDDHEFRLQCVFDKDGALKYLREDHLDRRPDENKELQKWGERWMAIGRASKYWQQGGWRR